MQAAIKFSILNILYIRDQSFKHLNTHSYINFANILKISKHSIFWIFLLNKEFWLHLRGHLKVFIF